MTSPHAPGRLVVCPTPIGNAGDLTPRVAAALAEADLIACEDTRRTGRLLSELGIDAPLVSLHEHNEVRRAPALVDRLREGATVALVSDAGTPGISDPGYVLVRAVADAGLPLTVLPGPSAVLAAVVASAMPLDRWRFVGFLPRKAAALLAELDQPGPLVGFESPRRLARTLQALAEHDPQRPVAVCRELTKDHEEVVRGSAAEVAAHFAEHEPLGEIVLVVGAPAAREDTGAALAALARVVEAGAKPREAAGALAELVGLPRNRLYDAWLRQG